MSTTKRRRFNIIQGANTDTFEIGNMRIKEKNKYRYGNEWYTRLYNKRKENIRFMLRYLEEESFVHHEDDHHEVPAQSHAQWCCRTACKPGEST